MSVKGCRAESAGDTNGADDDGDRCTCGDASASGDNGGGRVSGGETRSAAADERDAKERCCCVAAAADNDYDAAAVAEGSASAAALRFPRAPIGASTTGSPTAIAVVSTIRTRRPTGRVSCT